MTTVRVCVLRACVRVCACAWLFAYDKDESPLVGIASDANDRTRGGMYACIRVLCMCV